MMSTFTAPGYGGIISAESGSGATLTTQASDYKVTFYQVSMTPEGFIEADGVSFAYDGFTQLVLSGEQAKNPGMVAYAGKINNPAMRFLGWYEFNAPDDSPYDFSQPVTRDLELFARFTDDCLVSFLNGFGEAFLTKHVKPGDTVSAPTSNEMSLFTAPTGMLFDDENGWLQGKAPYAFDTTLVTTDITLTPSLVEGISVYFISAGSQVPFATTAIDATVSQPPAPTRPGYTFRYWSETDGGNTAFDFNTKLTTDLTLYAVWAPQTVDYTVVVWMEKKNISGDAGTAPSNYDYLGKFTRRATAGTNMTTVVSGAASLVAASTVRPPAWSSFGFAEATSATVLGNGTTTLNVYYKRTVYNFSFTPYNSSSAGTTNATMVIGGKTYTNANRYSFRAKYEQDVATVWPVLPLAQVSVLGSRLNFQGWKVPNVNSVFVSKVTTISIDLLPTTGTNQILTANWLTTGEWIDLNYMFETPNGKNMPGAVLYNGKYYAHDETFSQTVFSGGAPFILKEIRGMVALTSNALEKTATGFVVSTTRPLTEQYLFYDRNVFKISFDTRGGSPIADITGVRAGASLASQRPADPTRTDSGSVWVFDGWYTSIDYLTPFDFASATMPDTNLMLYAKWTQNPYMVSVYDGLANPNLLGTYQRAGGEYVGDPEAALAAVGIDAGYKIGTLYPGKGEFRGWVILIGPGKQTPLSTELPVMSNLAVYAEWSPQTFHITYQAGTAKGGTPPVDNNTYRHGVEARVLPPSDPANGAGSLEAPDGAVFTGWLDANGRLYYPNESLSIDGEIVLTAYYTILDKFAVYTYHINYPENARDGDGKDISDPGNIVQYVGQGQEFPVLSYDAYAPTPEPAGYRFMGWAGDEDRANAGTVDQPGGQRITAPTSANNPRIDIPFWGVWVRYLKVTFDADSTFGTLASGAVRANYMVPQDGALKDIGVEATPGVTPGNGYKFVGWALEESWPEITDKNAIPEKQVTEEVTYRAVYADESAPSPVGIEVVFDAGGIFGTIASGAVNTSYTVPQGETLKVSGVESVPEVTPKDGYEFVGWALSGQDATTDDAKILSAEVIAPVVYKAVYTGALVPPLAGIEVVFDAGGIFGTIAGGADNTSYTVPKGGNLSIDLNITATPSVTPKDGYKFIGWALSGQDAKTDDTDILSAEVIAPVAYKAVYTGTLVPPLVGIEVVFDSGGIFGTLAVGADSTS
jgi:uncharacterized repeat protein (TIGR02543 family)